jgi:3-oxoadipate enol-lactonase
MENRRISTSDGVELNVIISGDSKSPVLILSNSLGTEASMWEPQLEQLSRHFRVVRYDTRGHGESDAPATEYSLERLGQDVLDIADALSLDTFDFCGISLGGMTGLWLAIHAGQRLKHVVVANAAAFTGNPQMWADRIVTARDEGMPAIAAITMPRWFTPEFAESHAQVVKDIEEKLISTPLDGYVGCTAAIRDMDLRPYLGQIAVPLLVIGGEKDGGPPPVALQGMVKHIETAELVMIPAAHLSSIEAPEAFTTTVTGFLL